MSETVEIDYEKLAEAVLRNESFANRAAGLVAKNAKANEGTVKSQLEQYCSEWRKQREQEVRNELDEWFFGHVKRQIEKNKIGFMERLNTEVTNWLSSKLDTSFKDAGRTVIERLIRDKFSDVKMTFTIGDLFGDRDRDY